MNPSVRFFQILRATTLLLASTLIAVSAGAQQPPKAPPSFYLNPVIRGDYPDPSIVRVDDKNYLATATTSEWAPIFPLLYSRDLVNWTLAGAVFTNRPSWAVGSFWAPEVSLYKGKYYVYYAARKAGGPLSVAVATSSAQLPFGPYEDHGPIVSQEDGSIDPMAAVDENGDRYLIWKEDGNSRQKPTPIWAAKLSDDGTKLAGDMKELIRNDAPWEGNLVEGPFILRRGDYFYLFYSGNGCCGTKCNYMLGVARSKKLLGPYEKNPANPILSGNSTWKCPGHGSIVTDTNNRTFLLYHAYSTEASVFVGRQAMLDEVTWNTDGWPSINEGKGPSVKHESPLPLGLQSPGMLFDDSFFYPALNKAWQWPIDQVPRFKLERGASFHLTLQPQPGSKDNLGGVLAVPTKVADYSALSILDRTRLAAGALGGIAAFGDSRNAVYVSCSSNTATLFRRQKGKDQNLASIALDPGPNLYLRMDCRGGHKFGFQVAANPASWKKLGNDADLEGDFVPPWDRGVRIALISGGVENAEASYEWIKVVATPPQKK